MVHRYTNWGSVMGPLESSQANVTNKAAARTGAGGDSARGPGSRAALRTRRRRPSRMRKLDLAIILVLVILLALSATPWPSAMLIRSVFERGAQSAIDEMKPYVPDTPLEEHADVVYKPGSAFDVFSPRALPLRCRPSFGFMAVRGSPGLKAMWNPIFGFLPLRDTRPLG